MLNIQNNVSAVGTRILAICTFKVAKIDIGSYPCYFSH